MQSGGAHVKPQSTIGQLARLVGTSPKTVRRYESIGLMPKAPRTPAGYRLYDEGARRRLQLILRARMAGLSLKETRELLSFVLDGTCGDFRQRLLEMVGPKLAEVDKQIAEFRAFKAELRELRGRLERDAHVTTASDARMVCAPCACVHQPGDAAGS